MGTRKNRLAEAVLTSTHNLCFEQKYEKYQSFLSEKFQYLEVKFSIYLNRHVFVMDVDFKGLKLSYVSSTEKQTLRIQKVWMGFTGKEK